MTLQAPKRLRRPVRDALTGAPIEQGTLHYPVQTAGRDYARKPGYLERAGEQVIVSPLRLHTPRSEGETSKDGGGGKALGLEYSLFFGQYLAAALDKWKHDGAREVSEWWTSEYGRNRVYSRLGELFPDPAAEATFYAVLAVCQDHERPSAVAERLGRSYDWLGRQSVFCIHLAHMTTQQYAEWRQRRGRRMAS